MKKLLYILVAIIMLSGLAPLTAEPVLAADVYPWADDLSQAIQQENWEQAHGLARDILKEQGYKKTGNQAVDWFIDGERANILAKVQQDTVREIVSRQGSDALEGIINIGSHARWNNLKYIPGKSDMDFIFIGKNSVEADALFRNKLAQELGINDPEEALRLTKIGPSNDVQFSKLQQVKGMEDALQKGEQDVATFLKRLDDPQYAEYYKNFGADKYIENYNWQAGSFDRIDASGDAVTIIRDPGTAPGSLAVAEIGKDPTAAMDALYKSKGWNVPKMDAGDSWGLATNEYYFMQREMQELAGAGAAEKAVKLAKRAERLNEALLLSQMDPPAEFVAQTTFLRQGGTLTDEAAEVYLKELDRMTEVTLQRTLKAKIMTDLNRSWQPEWLGGNLKGEALDATVNFAETRKFLETTFGMKLVGADKAQQLMNNLDVPDYFKNIIGEEYGKALELAGDTKQLSTYISSQASRKTTVITAAEEAGDTANLQGFMSRFLTSPGGRITLEGLDVGLRLFTVYDAYEKNGWNGAANRAVLEGGAKWAAWKGITRADLALLAFDLSTMTIDAVGQATMDEMRNDNVMGIYTGVIPQREAGLLFIGLKNDVKTDYTSLFDSLNIKGLPDDTRAQLRSRLDGNQGFEKFLKENISWTEWAFGVSDERREEFKDIYVSLTNVNYMRGKIFEVLKPQFDSWIDDWQKAHGGESIYEKKNTAEYDLLVKSLLGEVLNDYRSRYLAEVEATGAWKGFDESTWAQMEDMINKDFEQGRGIYLDKYREGLKQEQFKKELNGYLNSAQNWLDKLFGAGEGISTRPSGINNMLSKAFEDGNQTPDGDILPMSITPENLVEGQTVKLSINYISPGKGKLQINIENTSSGAKASLTKVIQLEDKNVISILEITADNKEKWSGKNTVTAQLDIQDSDGTKILKGNATFTIVTTLKLTATVEPGIVTAGEEIKLSIEVTPPVKAELVINYPFPVEREEGAIYTDNEGKYEISVPVRAETPDGQYEISVEALIPSGNDFINLKETELLTVVSSLKMLLLLSPNSAKAGDIVDLTVNISPPLAAQLDIVVKNVKTGYSTSFSDVADEKGKAFIPILELTPGNQEVWFENNDVTVTARVPSGDRVLTAVETANFWVTPVVKMTAIISPQTVSPGDVVTLSIATTPPVETELWVSGDTITSYHISTGQDGKYTGQLNIDTNVAGDYEITVESQSLGLTKRVPYTVSAELPSIVYANIWVGDADGYKIPMSYSHGVLTGSISDDQGGYMTVTLSLSADLRTVSSMEVSSQTVAIGLGGIETIKHWESTVTNIPGETPIFPDEILAYFVYGNECLDHVSSYHYILYTHDPSGKTPDQYYTDTTDFSQADYPGIRVDIYTNP